MLTIDYFINGNTVDNDALMRQWQLCQEAQALSRVFLANYLNAIGWRYSRAESIYNGLRNRHYRRLSAMHQLINEWNKSTKIIEDQGDKLRHAVRVAIDLNRAGLGEFAAIPLEELPF